MLTSDEINDIWLSLPCDENHIEEFARKIERAVLAKAMPIPKQEPAFAFTGGYTVIDGKKYYDLTVDYRLKDGLPKGYYYAEPQPAQAAAIPEWMPIETAPKTGRKILLSLVNIAGKRRTIVGFWVEKFSVEDNSDDDQGEEKDGTYYWREGWYESMESHDDFSCLYAAQQSITHWMPLPDASTLSASPKPE